MLKTFNNDFWSEITKRCIVDVQPVNHGRNSRVLKLICRHGDNLAAKQYYRHPDDHRDRLQAEVDALNICREHNIVNVPEIITVDKGRNLAVFTFIDGERPRINTSTLEQAVIFLQRLQEISAIIPPDTIGNASEAFFSANLILKNINERLKPLQTIEKKTFAQNAMTDFLSNIFESALRKAEAHCRMILDKAGISFQQCIGNNQKILSPSDFGFHNSMKNKNGELFFFDFEYFGWDDPAKTICDFVMHPHPAMSLNKDMIKEFLSKCAIYLPEQTWRLRARAYYPLFRCKWSLILLNEFLPQALARRCFAKAITEDIEQILLSQLKKAEKCILSIWTDYENFSSSMA